MVRRADFAGKVKSFLAGKNLAKSAAPRYGAGMNTVPPPIAPPQGATERRARDRRNAYHSELLMILLGVLLGAIVVIFLAMCNDLALDAWRHAQH